MKIKSLPPIHPDKILFEEFLTPMGITQYRLAKDTSVPPRRINKIVHQKRAITTDTALRLGVFLNKSNSCDNNQLPLGERSQAPPVEKQKSPNPSLKSDIRSLLAIIPRVRSSADARLTLVGSVQ